MTSTYVQGFHNALSAQVKAHVPAQVLSVFDNPNVLLSQDLRNQLLAKFSAFGPQGKVLYTQILDAVKVGLTNGVHNVFVLSTVLMCVGFVAIFFLEEIPLRGGKRSAESMQTPEDKAEGTASVVVMQ